MRFLWRSFAGFLLTGLYSMFASVQMPLMLLIQRIVAPDSLLPGATGADNTVLASFTQAGFWQTPYPWVYVTKIVLTVLYGYTAVFLIRAAEAAFDRRDERGGRAA